MPTMEIRVTELAISSLGYLGRERSRYCFMLAPEVLSKQFFRDIIRLSLPAFSLAVR